MVKFIHKVKSMNFFKESQIDFESSVWDVTDIVNIPGRGMVRYRYVFKELDGRKVQK